MCRVCKERYPAPDHDCALSEPATTLSPEEYGKRIATTLAQAEAATFRGEHEGCNYLAEPGGFCNKCGRFNRNEPAPLLTPFEIADRLVLKYVRSGHIFDEGFGEIIDEVEKAIREAVAAEREAVLSTLEWLAGHANDEAVREAHKTAHACLESKWKV